MRGPRLRRAAAVALLLLPFGALAAVPAVAAAVHGEGATPSAPPDLSGFEKPFAGSYYLIHLLGTNTTGGFVPKDVYILNPEEPVGGWFLTPDGTGGTFNNKGNLIAGPLTTPRAVCEAASGRPAQYWEVEGRGFDCRVLSPSDGGGGVPPLLAAAGAVVIVVGAGGGIAYAVTHRPKPPAPPADGTGAAPETPVERTCAQMINAYANERSALMRQMTEDQLAAAREISRMEAERQRLLSAYAEMNSLRNWMNLYQAEVIGYNLGYWTMLAVSVWFGQIQLVGSLLTMGGVAQQVVEDATGLPNKPIFNPLALDTRRELLAKYAPLKASYEAQARELNTNQQSFLSQHQSTLDGLRAKVNALGSEIAAIAAKCHPDRPWDRVPYHLDPDEFQVPEFTPQLVPWTAP